jgi:Carboxypeptidase regulatory-like domain
LFQAVIDDPKLAGTFVPVPFAMREAPGPRIQDLGNNPSQRFASGRWQRHENEEDKSVGDASGVLKLTDALPLHVGLSVRGVVLDQRLVPAGSDEVVFVVPLDRLRALVSGVQVRLVSSRDGLPIAGASVEVEGLEALATNAQGEATLDGVPPGSHRITFEAQGVERRQEWIEVEPGAKNDLGIRQLSPALKITGRVVDENGAPVQVTVKLGELDAQVPGHSLPIADSVDTDAEGRFVFERAGRGRYTVSVEGDDRAAPVTTVDTRQGEVPELLLQAPKCGEVKLTFPIEPPPGSLYVVDTADGIPVTVECVQGWEPLVIRLGYGKYRARVVSTGRTLRTYDVIVHEGGMGAFDEDQLSR